MSETEIKGLNQKLLELHKKIGDADWTPDGEYSKKTTIIRFVSGKKMKRTIRPMLDELGLVFKMNIIDVQPLPACGVKENHVLIKAEVILTDTETGEKDITTVFSEGADAGDKAILNGISYAKRIYWKDNYDIVDGLEDVDNLNMSDVSANIIRSALPESDTPAPALIPRPPSPGGIVPKPYVAETPSAPAPSISSPGEGNLTKMQIVAMNNALSVIVKAGEEGRILQEHVDKAKEIRSKASCKEDVEALLNIKRELNL